MHWACPTHCGTSFWGAEAHCRCRSGFLCSYGQREQWGGDAFWWAAGVLELVGWFGWKLVLSCHLLSTGERCSSHPCLWSRIARAGTSGHHWAPKLESAARGWCWTQCRWVWEWQSAHAVRCPSRNGGAECRTMAGIAGLGMQPGTPKSGKNVMQ